MANDNYDRGLLAILANAISPEDKRHAYEMEKIRAKNEGAIALAQVKGNAAINAKQGTPLSNPYPGIETVDAEFTPALHTLMDLGWRPEYMNWRLYDGRPSWDIKMTRCFQGGKQEVIEMRFMDGGCYTILQGKRIAVNDMAQLAQVAR